jgi:hypothetical protein
MPEGIGYPMPGEGGAPAPDAQPMPAPAPDYTGMLDELMDEYPELEKEAMALQNKLDDLMPEDEAAPEALPEPSLDEEDEELSL